MKLGRIPLDRAAGAILAHTMRLPDPDRRVLKKGRVLDHDDVAALAAAGHDGVIAAALDRDSGDMAEDQAAALVGAAVAGKHVRVAEAFTGRCNLFAGARGLAVVDRDRIDALNAVSEALTLATVPAHAPVHAGDLVATVKIIPFAVSRRILDRCADIARGGLVSVAPLASARAAMVLTRLPGVSERVLDRAAANMRTRLAALGSELACERRCAHEEDAVAGAVCELLGQGLAPILILGASAIVDRADVIPAGIVRAGGTIVHFGMPVDPGNLLLLARAGTGPGAADTAIIGVPGCARSLKPSGFDWVLQRVLAGMEVSPRDIMAMGVGGLLADIAGRPQPRLPAPDDKRHVIAGLLMAAGRSARMGPENKLLIEIEGTPMVARAADALLASSARPIVVVTGHQAERVRAALAAREVAFVHNPDHAHGMSTSVRAAIAAIEGSAHAAVVCLGDMPWTTAAHIEALIRAYNPVEGREICVPVHQGKRGNPVLFGARFFAEMKALSGDSGARRLIERHADVVHEVAIADTGVLVDVDTVDALRALSPASEP